MFAFIANFKAKSAPCIRKRYRLIDNPLFNFDSVYIVFTVSVSE